MPAHVPTAADLQRYHDEGYILLRNAFTKQRIQSMVDGLNRLMDRAIAGEVQIGWIDRDKRLPARIGHMLHPDKYDESWANWLAEDLTPILEAMVAGPVRHSLFGMLAGGGGQPYLQAWHRDLAKPGAPDEAEHLLRHHGKFVQFNAPLMADDRYLHIVPGSHRRVSTAQEIKAASGPHLERKNPNAPLTAEEHAALDKWNAGEGHMPGAMVVEMQPGDIVFYNANLWHRGWNQSGGIRWTMHCAFWRPDYAVMQHEYNQRDAMLTPGHLDRMPKATRAQIERYLAAYPESKPKSLLEL